MQTVLASLRVAFATLLVVVAGYTLVMLGIAAVIAPDSAQGSLIRDRSGAVVGSRLVAQKFSAPDYFWPRPSAVDYNGAGAGGSNKSPTNPYVAKRAAATVAQYGATAAMPLPADLAAASGGGLDPHISERGALYQVPRIAAARRQPAADIEKLVRDRAFSPGGSLTPDRIVNVLELNLALNDRSPAPKMPPPRS